MASDRATKQYLGVLREIKILRARDNLQDFIEYMMPDPDHHDDVRYSAYISQPIHKLMVNYWEEIDSGRSMRSALSVPPQTGKTTHTTIMGSAWSIGRKPSLKIINGTYNEERAKKNGTTIRRVIDTPRYRDVFPKTILAIGGKAKHYLETTLGGYVLMAGRGSGITGNPCDIMNIDDPIKDKAEANSTAALQEAWDWFSTTCIQRLHAFTRVSINHTRWANNDLIGRICDPDNAEYDKDLARGWTYLNVKAYNNEPHIADLLGIKPEDYIWPEKFTPELLEAQRKIMSAEDFSALFMGKPVPDEGGFFQKSMIKNYTRSQLPQSLRMYAASDHGVRTGQHNDYTVMIVAGVDTDGGLWLVDCVREKIKTDVQVEHMVRLMKAHEPITWWAGRDHISGSIGPFLTNRRREEHVTRTVIQELSEKGDKQQKAQSIRGMMSLGLVHFPFDAPWYADCVNELLRFRGNGDTHDDFVDAMANLGRGLDWIVKAKAPTANDDDGKTRFGTMAWVTAATAQTKAAAAARQARAGW